ncbi:hypothetical protein OHA37_27005 [Streptomyces sp. NBC_00335]|uniref:hypothetical protein n=1 Tax=unclassified Streptomyces TaxID=2593676 RepID=UPI00224D4354|nr:MULTISPECIES: hypothetical protein [unclassified Streptomyces]MCX5407500.1 hypothetical protein [Streptomyces sp. NBC_00086]
MARIQILELPSGVDEERPPFILVVDQWEAIDVDAYQVITSYWDAFGEKIGARGVLFAECTVGIPANEALIGPDGYPLRFQVEGDFTRFREQVEEQALYAQGKLTRAMAP